MQIHEDPDPSIHRLDDAGCVQIPHLLHAGRRVLGALRNLYVDELLGRVQLEPVQSHTVLLDPRRQHAHYQYTKR